MTSGTTAATTAPNAISRIRNVSGSVSRSDESSPPLTSSWISLLARWLLRAWIARSGWAARISSTNAGTGSSRGSRASPSPATRAGIRTAVRSGETSPAFRRRRRAGRPAGRRSGPSRRRPWTGAPSSRATMSAIGGRGPDRRRCRPSPPTTRRSCWLGRLDGSRPGAEDVVGAGRLELARLVVRDRLAAPCRRRRCCRAKSPIVATNHSTKTGQRWRALQPATRTVHGGRATARAGAGLGWGLHGG